MNKQTSRGWIWLNGFILLGFPVASVVAVDTNTQVQTDGSLTIATPLSINAAPASNTYTVTEASGQAQSGNLFFSFDRFNIGSGDIVDFALDNGWDNVVTRVTGDSASIINGKLSVSGGYAASFFLINPHGIAFGANSAIDVPGSFYATTATSLNFSDGHAYSADIVSQPSQLSADTPESFGFLGNETGTISLDNANLRVLDDERIELASRDITLTSSSMGMRNLFDVGYGSDYIDGVQILLLASHDAGNIALDGAAANGVTFDGNITLTDSILDAGGDSEEIQLIKGGDISLNNSHIVADSYGDDCGGCETTAQDNSGEVPGNIDGSGIQVVATGRLTLDTNSSIEAETSFGPVGGISIQADSLLIDHNSKISASSVKVEHISADYLPVHANPVQYAVDADAGNVSIQVANDVEINHGSSILSSTETYGNAGHVDISAASVTLDNNASIKTESTANNGIIGYVLDGSGARLDSSSTTAYNAGHAGRIRIDADNNIRLSGNSQVSTGINAGVASTSTGEIAMTAGNRFEMSGSSSTISASTDGQASAGKISITGSNGLSVSGGTIETNSRSGAANAGYAGEIALNAGQGDLSLNGADISTNISGGPAGNSRTGDLELTARNISMDNSAVSASTSGGHDAGRLTVTASGRFGMDNQSSLKTDATGVGSAGTIVVANNRETRITSGSLISSSTSGAGDAGSISVATDKLAIVGSAPIPVANLGRQYDSGFTGIKSSASSISTGQAGRIEVSVAGDATLSNGAQISTSNDGSQNPGDTDSSQASIDISAKNLSLHNSQIVASSSGYVDAGDISVHLTGGDLYLDPSAISTSSVNGNGGGIDIDGANLIWLLDSLISTSVGGTSPGLLGGNINMAANFMLMDSGYILANSNSLGGGGGQINIQIDNIIPGGGSALVGGLRGFSFQPYSGINVIQAVAPDGVNGVVDVSSPQLNLSGTLANIVVPRLDQNVFTQNMCAIGEESSLTEAGRGALPRRAGDSTLWSPR